MGILDWSPVSRQTFTDFAGRSIEAQRNESWMIQHVRNGSPQRTQIEPVA
jgi:hypothetical protein